jgi:hypothetical protein
MDGRSAVEYVVAHKVPGVFVECGVEDGKQEIEWIHTLKALHAERTIVLYDTFAGLTRPGEHDYTLPTATICSANKESVLREWESRRVSDRLNTWCYSPLDRVKANLESIGYPGATLRYVVGDVMTTLRDDASLPDAIAILRLDTDWYESSKYELERLYERVSPGGVVIFDDYYHWNGQRKATDEFFSSIGVTPDIRPVGNQKTGSFVKNLV